MQRIVGVKWLLPGAFLALFLLLALGGRPAAAGPAPAGLPAADWAQIAAQLPAPAAPAQQGYLKASNAGVVDYLGWSVAVDGDTVVVGAPAEDSNGTGGESDNSALGAGAAYVFVRSGSSWSQQAYLKASNAGASDQFGIAVAVDGDTVVVGANTEDGNGTGGESDNSANAAGAAYVFVRSGSSWSQQAYLKASNAGAGDGFGVAVAIAGDTVVAGAPNEDGNGTGGESDNSASFAGAAYVFVRSGSSWSQQAYLKAANVEAGDAFGCAVAVDGDTVVAGAYGEDGNGTGGQSDNSANAAGAAYVFVRSGSSWSQEAYLKASNAEASDAFGYAVGVDGDTVVAGAYGEDGNSTGGPLDNSVNNAGAAYVFTRSGTSWSQQGYLKASNVGAGDNFAHAVAVAGDTVVAGAPLEDGNGTGGESDNSAADAGAAYVFTRSGTSWSQQAYLKAANVEAGDAFGYAVAVAGDTVVAGANTEDGNGTGGQSDNSATDAGAAYVFDVAAGVYVSAVSAGVTGDGLAFGPHDILLWDGGAWSKWFDGSAAGLMPKGQNVHNIMAFWIPDPDQPDVALTFAQNRRVVPDIPGKVDGTDIVWWDGSGFALWFDGQDVGLTVLTTEKVDSLHVLDGSEAPPALAAAAGGSCLDYLLISTQGAGKVANYSGGTLKFGGEDVLGFCMTQSGATTMGKWIMVLDGSAEGMPKDSLTGLSASDDGQTLYLTTRSTFNVDSASGGPSMVYKYEFATGDFSGPFFSAPAEGLPPRVAGLQVDGELP